jgi:hypothetical protein
VTAFKGTDEVRKLEEATRRDLDQYVSLARRFGFPAAARMEMGPDVVATASSLIEAVSREFPDSIVFAGQSVFRKPGVIHRLLHNETAFAIQQELRWKGITTVILPIRINI